MSGIPDSEQQRLIERLAAFVEAESRALVSEAKAARDEAESELAETRQRLEAAERAREDAERERDHWRSQADELGKRTAELDREVRALRFEAQVKAAASEASRELAPEPGEEITDVAGAVSLAKIRFPSLRFLPEAVESAAASTYTQPEKVYAAFEALDDLADARVAGSLGRSIKDWLRDRGFEYAAHESQTTMGMYGGERTFRYLGAKITMEEHIKFGIGPDPRLHLRIHLMWHEGESRWLIGHVGRHLTNTKS